MNDFKIYYESDGGYPSSVYTHYIVTVDGRIDCEKKKDAVNLMTAMKDRGLFLTKDGLSLSEIIGIRSWVR